MRLEPPDLMMRFTTIMFAAILTLSLGCEQPEQVPGPPPTGGGEASEAEQASGEANEQADEEAASPPSADDTAAGDDESAPEAEDTAPSAESDACPEARQPEGMCAQVITWAKNPDTGACCQYPSPCHAPEDWKTFSSEDACGK